MGRRNRRNRRNDRSVPGFLVVVTALSVLGFVAALAYTLVLPPTSTADDATATQPAGLIASVQDQPTETELALAASGIVETFEVFGAKNPFERPLAQIAPPAQDDGGDDDDGNTDDGTDDGNTDDGTDDGETDDTTTTTPTTVFDPDRSRRVELTEIYVVGGETVANVIVDSFLYEAVAVGDTFATTFQVVSLDQGTECGEFLNGDVDFELCVGQEILK